MKAPYPYQGGKSFIVDKIWAALGNPAHYLEPFFGSGAALLNRPNWLPSMTETVNDINGFIANVWRALQYAPDEVAKFCDWPVNHADLAARRKFLNAHGSELIQPLADDPEFYDAKMAGYWIWAASCWIGTGLTDSQIPHIGHAGMGINSQIPHVSHAGMGIPKDAFKPELYQWFRQLQERLRNVRVVCGDWTRVCGGKWQDKIGTAGIFFDPPYGVEDRDTTTYAHDSVQVAHDVRAWCLERGSSPNYRIVLCGYEEHEAELSAAGWRVEAVSSNGGYANTAYKEDSTAIGKANRHRERIYYSPHCLIRQETLFSERESIGSELLLSDGTL